MKLLLVIIEGQLYLAGIIAVFVAELALLLWGLFSRRPIIGLLAVFATLPLLRTTASAIRASFFRVRAPEGLPLERSEAGALCDLVEEIRRAVAAPPVDGITVTGGFHASAAVDTPSWWLRRRRTLVLGFPVLTTLSLHELRAVIAHELAHFSSAHDPFASWVYRTRASWLALRTALDRRLATPVYVYWILRWYEPRLKAASAEVSRRHELVADRVAMTVAGSRAAADALLVFESGERFADDTHWPAIQAAYQTAAVPPRPYSEMLTWNARQASTDLVESLLADDTESDDTHPSLRERLARFGQTARVPPPMARSAGHELLGPQLEVLAQRLDERWMARYGDLWRQHRAEYVERTTMLERLAAIETPTPDEVFERARLVEWLRGSDEALPIYRLAAEQGHSAAGVATGRVLLDRLEPAGIALVEAAMDGDERLVPEGCEILAAYYMKTNQQLAARRCEWRATRHTTLAHLSGQSTAPS
jgi:Zn-dependent protease with chaperone function